MAFCGQCGKEVAPNAKFCKECGAPIKKKDNPDVKTDATVDVSANVKDDVKPDNKADIKEVVETVEQGISWIYNAMEATDAPGEMVLSAWSEGNALDPANLTGLVCAAATKAANHAASEIKQKVQAQAQTQVLTPAHTMPKSSGTKFCRFCGGEINAGAAFCRHCGKQLLLLALMLIVPAVLSFLVSFTSLASDDEGYWLWDRTVVTTIPPENTLPEYYKQSFDASELSHYYREHYTGNDYSPPSTGEFTCTVDAPPPEKINIGTKVTMKLKMKMVDNASYVFSASAAISYGAPNEDDSGIMYNAGVRFGSTTEGGNNKVYLDTCDNTPIPEAEVYHVFTERGRKGDELAILFHGCHSSTLWVYKWVDASEMAVAATEGESEDEWEDIYDPWQEQKEDTQASDTPGSTSTGIQEGIVEGKDHSGGGAFTVVPMGLVIIGGAAYVHYRRKKKKQPDDKTKPANKAANNAPQKQEEKKEQKKKPSSYRMILYKDFGGKLRVNAKPETVCARIEELRPNEAGGTDVIKRNDLTGKIRVEAVKNLQVTGSGMKGEYMAAKVKVPQGVPVSETEKATLEFRFTGEGGSIRNRVNFGILGESEIVLITGAGTGMERTAKIHKDAEMHLLIDDSEGSELYFGVKNFFEKPEVVELTGKDIKAKVEYRDDIKVKDVFVYKAVITNELTSTSQYGLWPVERKLEINALNGHEERAEAEIKGSLWPEGIFFDVSQIKKERVRENDILVDTTDIMYSNVTELHLEMVPMEVGVAYKKDKNVFVTRPNKPDDVQYRRLTAAETRAEVALNSKPPRIWYELDYKDNSTYSNRPYLGTLILNPLIPAVLESEKDELHASYELRYEQDDKYYKATVMYAFKGLAAKMNDAERTDEIKRIKMLLGRMRLEDMTRVNNVLRKYGKEAEDDLLLLGDDSTKRALDMNELELMRSLDEIKSVHRLRAIRHLIYEEAYRTVSDENINAMKWAEYYDILCTTAEAIRWVDDLAFSAWWYLMFKGNGGAIEPFMTPIKDLFLKYIEHISDLDLIERGKVKSPDEFFNYDKFMEAMMEGIEASLFSVLVTGAVDGGTGALSKNQIMGFMGLISAFVFAKNCRKYTEYDPNTKTLQTDMWLALKGTAQDLTLDTLKAIVTIVVGKIVGKVWGKDAPDEVNPTKKKVLDKLKGDLDEMLSINSAVPKNASYFEKLKTYLVTQNNLFQKDSPDVGFAAIYRLYFAKDKSEILVGKTYAAAVAARDKEFSTAFDYMANLVAGTFIDDAADDDALGVDERLDEWAKNCGQYSVGIKMDDGKVVTLKLSLPALVCIYLNKAFNRLGITENAIDLNSVLPDEMPYHSRTEMVEILQDIPKSDKEIMFIEHGDRRNVPSSSPFADTAEAPTMDIGTDIHKYAK